MATTSNNWKPTSKRFVSFFDIMGFKDTVERNTHNVVLKKLSKLKLALKVIEDMNSDDNFKKTFKVSETKSITFSDSIIIFSKSDTLEDACKILADSSWLLSYALKHGIAIKGALAFGQITVDIENSLFFGRPIIDAFLLHEQLQMYSAIIDNTCEAKFNSLKIPFPFSETFCLYKAPMKFGKVSHNLLRADNIKQVKEDIKFLNKMYVKVSGSPRIYIDNTLDYFNYIVKNIS